MSPIFKRGTEVLFTPLFLGRGKTLKNRVVVPAHSYNLTREDGSPSRGLVEYVRARVDGGVGLIILGETYVADEFLKSGTSWGASISSDNSIPIYEEVAKLAHEAGCLIFDQLCHPGGQFWTGGGGRSHAPSPIAHDSAGGVPQEMSASEIRYVISCYVNAALVARSAGLDGVEIKADQGKLPHQFLSAKYNLRTDEYGYRGRFGRLTFLFEVLKQVRSAIGGDMILGIRLPVSTYESDDLSDAECLANFKAIVDTGLVDYVSLNGATNSTPMGYARSHGDLGIKPVTFEQDALRFRDCVGVNFPLFLAGRVMTSTDAHLLLESGVADAVAMARTHIADPAFARKVEEGRESEIIPCIGCNQSCVGNTWEGNPIRCIHNPATGLEEEFADQMRRLEEKRLLSNAPPPHILIAGAGVAGLEAARCALDLGARVTVVEVKPSVGGSINQWAILEPRRGFDQIVGHLKSEVARLGCDPTQFSLLLNTRADASLIRSLEPDIVIDATGGDISSALSSGTSSRVKPIVAISDFDTYGPAEHVVVQADHPLLGGLPLAIRIAQGGSRVTVTNLQDFSTGLDLVTHTMYMRAIRSLPNINLMPFTRPIIRDDGSIQIWDLLTETTLSIDAETVIQANGKLPNRVFSDELQGCGIHSISIGDAASFRGIEFAIRDGRSEVIKLLIRWFALRKEKSWTPY